jgi:hypothetical protein
MLSLETAARVARPRQAADYSRLGAVVREKRQAVLSGSEHVHDKKRSISNLNYSLNGKKGAHHHNILCVNAQQLRQGPNLSNEPSQGLPRGAANTRIRTILWLKIPINMPHKFSMSFVQCSVKCDDDGSIMLCHDRNKATAHVRIRLGRAQHQKQCQKIG